MSSELSIQWLGRVGFAEAWRLQEEIVAERHADDALGDILLLLEHDPVYTIGRTPDRSSLRNPAQLPYPVFPINRGGQATYHGPGQLIGYPIINLRLCRQDLHLYLRWLEELLIQAIAEAGIAASTRSGLTGVWVGDRKIASIGVGVRHWITMHGFALNICGDLAPFDQIVPCGISNVRMTSIEMETGKQWSVREFSERLARIAERSIHELRKRELVECPNASRSALDVSLI